MPHWFSQYTANTCVCHAKNAYILLWSSSPAGGENKLVNSIDPMHAFRMREKSSVRQTVNCTRLTTLCVINVACNSFRARWAFTALSAVFFFLVGRQKPKWNTKRLFVEKIISKLNECSCGANSPENKETHFPTNCCFIICPFTCIEPRTASISAANGDLSMERTV